MSDRLEEIKATFEDRYLAYEDVQWLITEVERLTAEAAALRDALQATREPLLMLRDTFRPGERIEFEAQPAGFYHAKIVAALAAAGRALGSPEASDDT